MELRQLEHFVTVAQEGGFARAARRLSLSQPTLTRSIGALEDHLKVSLFDRSNRGTTLNAAGNKLLPHAVAMLQEAERARAEFGAGGYAGGPEPVRIGISPNMLYTPFPKYLREAIQNESSVRYVVSTGTHETLYKGLRQRDLDLAICLTTGVPLEPKAEYVKYRVIGREQVVPVARSDHAALAQNPPSLEAISRYRWAVPLQLSVTYRFDYLFHQRGIPLVAQTFNSSSLELTLRAVAEWGLLGMLPRTLLEQNPFRSTLVELEIPELILGYDISVMRNSGDDLSAVALELVDALEGDLGGPSAGSDVRGHVDAGLLEFVYENT